MEVRERLYRRHHRQQQGARLHGPATQAAGQTTGVDAGQQRHHQPHQGRGWTSARQEQLYHHPSSPSAPTHSR